LGVGKYADGQHLGVALAPPSPRTTTKKPKKHCTDHDESMDDGNLQGDRGRISTTSMWPCLHCLHCGH
jgi:hypothetical protein